VGILLGASLVSFLGIWDDRHSLRPLFKLLGQLVAALILIYSGVQVNIFPFQWLNVAVSVLWVVGITNALNLLDNMDGLSGGVAAIASAFLLLLAAMSGQYLVGSLAAALLGACLGFLYYNFNPATIFAPASIFLGDSGSLFLGFVLAAVGIKLRFPTNSFLITWMIPIVVLWLPIFDTALVVISRLRRGLNPLTSPGRDHVSHRLVARGFSRREAVLTLYLVCGVLGVLAIFISQAGALEAYLVGGGMLAISILALWRLEADFKAS
jgi:UDP-GlcNAc:undecaprenyl-phosphate GlcNAc-1-phosphate transferase